MNLRLDGIRMIYIEVCAFANDYNNDGGGYILVPIHPVFLEKADKKLIKADKKPIEKN